MDKITYDYYRIFYYVAKYGSFSRAAELLNSNQPNVTKFINNLESQLDCKLMLRSNKGITLTEEGKKLFSYVSVAYMQLKQAEDELAGANRFKTGSLRIGATELALHGILLKSLAAFKQKYPDIRLYISNDTTVSALDSLQKGIIDIAVVTSPTDTPSDIKSTVLLPFEEILLTSASSPYAEKTQITVPELFSYPIIGLGQHSKTYEFYSDLFLPYGFEWVPNIHVATADQILPIIEAGLGVGFVPEFIAEKQLGQKNVVKINVEGPIPKRNIILLEDKTKSQNAIIREFKKMLL